MTDNEPTVRYWRQDATGYVDTMRADDVNEGLISSDWTEVHVLSDAELDAIKAEAAEKARADADDRWRAAEVSVTNMSRTIAELEQQLHAARTPDPNGDTP